MLELFLNEGISLDITQGPTATIVWAGTANSDFSATGEAKLMPTDEYDEEIGIVLATARALSSLSEVMEDYAFKKSHLHHG